MARIVLGISGGVDSSVAALLLKQCGHEVIGLFMRNWEEVDAQGVCTAEEDFRYAQNVCEKLDIPYHSVNYAKQYRDKVFAQFLQEYEAGRTPNPDVLCNREIKFGPFLDFALALGADYVATGHYCGVRHEVNQHYLLRSVDESKDQTYFLCQLSQQQLSKTLFPLQLYTKAQVREIARTNNLPTAERKDSTGICFIGERNFKQFLSNYAHAKQGEIVTPQGDVVGKHDGLCYYTRGQRKGLGIGGVGDDKEGRWFVLGKELATNKLIVSHGEEGALYDNSCEVSRFNWIPNLPLKTSFECFARFRHRQPLQKVTVSISTPTDITIKCNMPQRALTEGQFAVLYDEDCCLGGGTLERYFNT